MCVVCVCVCARARAYMCVSMCVLLESIPLHRRGSATSLGKVQ